MTRSSSGRRRASSRQEQYKAVEAVEAPNADTVIFRL
jgi:hypothetical protein